MEVRLTQIDGGDQPNLALMKLAHWHRAQGDNVTLARTPSPSMFEPKYDRVYGSAIFNWSAPVVQRLRDAFPEAIIGGTGTGDLGSTVERHLGLEDYEHYDYTDYPDYPFSLGFTQRGCRLNCGFCVVPKKEGKPKSVNTIWDIWRPETERRVVLLDNDFFGQPEAAWKARIQEMQDGGFKVSFNQGVNIRMITEETAAALASVLYYDAKFKDRRLYTAWDNLGQETVFFKGVDLLEAAGVSPKHLMVYMLIGYKPGETMEDILYRHGRLVERGCTVYPMVYDNSNKELKKFQRYVIRGSARWLAWDEYREELTHGSANPATRGPGAPDAP